MFKRGKKSFAAKMMEGMGHKRHDGKSLLLGHSIRTHFKLVAAKSMRERQVKKKVSMIDRGTDGERQ